MKKLLTFCLLSYIMSSLISEHKPDFLILQEFREEFYDIQQTLSIKSIDFGNFDYSSPTLGKVSFSNFQLQLTSLDTQKLILNVQETNFQFKDTTPNTLKLRYSFKYTIDQITDNGDFSLFSEYFLFNKSFNIVDDILKVLGNVDFILKSGIINYTGDKMYEELINAGINEFIINKLNNSIKDGFIKDITNYYQNIFRKEKIDFIGYDPKRDYSLDLTYDRIPSKITEGRAIFYRSGKLNNIESDHVAPIFKEENSYQLLITKQLILNFLKDKSLSYDYTLRNDNLPEYSPFMLNVQYFGLIIPELYNLYSRNNEIRVWNNITDLTLNSDMTGSLNIYTEVQILLESEYAQKIFEFNTLFEFKLKDSLKSKSLNFFVDSLTLKRISSSSSYQSIFIDRLRDWVKSMYKNYFKYNQQFFFNNPIDMSPFFSNFISINGTFNENGYLIIAQNSLKNNYYEVKYSQKLFTHDDLFPNFLN